MAIHKFNITCQKDNENITDFVTNLKSVALDCNFSESERETRISEQFIIGIKDTNLKLKLIEKSYLLKSTELFDKASQSELSKINIGKLSGTFSTLDVNYVNNSVNQYKNRDFVTYADRKCNSNRNYSHDKNDNSYPKREKLSSVCYRCGQNHVGVDCKYKNYKCNFCSKIGHLEKVCRSKNNQHSIYNKPKPVNQIEQNYENDNTSSSDVEDVIYTIRSIENSSCDRLIGQFELNKVFVTMEVDTGASVSIINYETLSKLGLTDQIVKSNVLLKSYGGKTIPTLGIVKILVRVGQYEKELCAHVVREKSANLFGLPWIKEFGADVVIPMSLNKVSISDKPNSLDILVKKYAGVFTKDDNLQPIDITPVKIKVDDSHPKYFRPRPIPLALQARVKDELASLQKTGVLERVEYSVWPSPVVTVAKANGRV